MGDAFELSETYVHLGLGATATPLPDFRWDGASLARYEDEHDADGDDGRLVMVSTSHQDWDFWECHPAGDELVVVLDGRSVLVQERGGAVERTEMGPGDAAINPRGVWHTADVAQPCRMLFVTPGRGTLHRPR
jgi:mannose-6-phosphate isomerase-like protein (cupin superfamily)